MRSWMLEIQHARKQLWRESVSLFDIEPKCQPIEQHKYNQFECERDEL